MHNSLNRTKINKFRSSIKTSRMSEKFCLKWNDFETNVSKSFGLLRNEDYLHDVTLVCDDNKQVSAHKLMLSACSEFFKSIFKNNLSVCFSLRSLVH